MRILRFIRITEDEDTKFLNIKVRFRDMNISLINTNREIIIKIPKSVGRFFWI